MLRTSIALAVLLCVPTLASAQMRRLDPFQQTVHNQLRASAEVLEVAAMTHEIWMGQLRDGEDESVTLELDANTEYLILGVCDEDCDDLDLVLHEGESQVADDYATDDYPILMITPSLDTEYRVEAIMASCSVSPCRYGIGVYRQ